MREICTSGSMRGGGNGATAEPLRHRQTKGAANRYAQPNATAPHSYSTDTCRPLRANSGHPDCAKAKGLRPQHFCEAHASYQPGDEVPVFRFRVGSAATMTIAASSPSMVAISAKTSAASVLRTVIGAYRVSAASLGVP